MNRRRLMHSLLASFLASMAPWALVRAQGFPGKPITLVVPYPAGGPTDRVCRVAAELASARLGQPMVIFNQPGAGGTLGIVNSVLSARPDGYTLGLYSGGMLRVSVLQKTHWHPINDFTFVAGLLQSTGHDMGLVVKAESPYGSFVELRDAARREPGKISVGSAGVGSGVHIAVESLADAAGIELLHIPYKGSAELIPAVLGGHVSAILDLAGGWEHLVEQGSLRLLLTFGDRPSSRRPQIPTAKALGYNVSGVYSMGIVGPAGIDKSVVDVLQAVFASVANDSHFTALLQQQDQLPWPVTGAACRAWNIEQLEKERSILRRLGLAAS